MEKKGKIGWFCGRQDWAYRNLVSHLIKVIPDYDHVINRCGDVNILLAVDQLDLIDPDSSIILHLDSNRWGA